MPKASPKFLVITSGGDAPGMNAAIRAVVRSCYHQDCEIYGAIGGYEGIAKQNLLELTPDSVANIIQRGGTILGSGRYQDFHDATVRQECHQYLKQNHITGLVVIGGDGSFRGANLLAELGDINVIGIPATIDNDIHHTEYTIGFDTALNTALRCIDNIRDTASSHNHNFLVEVMGRNSGFLALDVGLAGGAEYILTPEFPITSEELAQRLQQPKRKKLSSIIVVAEADKPGRSVELAEDIAKLTQMKYRVCILGHTQRGGSPTVFDRKIASWMGVNAVEALLAGESGKMVNWEKSEIGLVPFAAANTSARQVTGKELFQISEILAS